MKLFSLFLGILLFPSFAEAQLVEYTVKLADYCSIHADSRVEVTWMVPSTGGTYKTVNPNIDPPEVILPDVEYVEVLPVDDFYKKFIQALSNNFYYSTSLDFNGDGVINASDIPLLRDKLIASGGTKARIVNAFGLQFNQDFPVGSCLKLNGVPDFFEPSKHLYQRCVDSVGKSYWAGPASIDSSLDTSICNGVIDIRVQN